MSRSAPSGPTFSFRNIPPAIYVALGVNVAGSLAFLIAALRTSGETYERYQALERWFMLDGGCDAAYAVLFPLGLLELARRHVGSQRVLTRVAAGLGFASLAWLGIHPLLALLEPSFETRGAIYEWLGRGIGVTALAAAVLLTIGADAWRRVPIAAAGLVVLGATGHWVPVIGQQIRELIGDDLTSRQLYGHARLGLQVIALLFVTAALAAGGRDPAPDPRAAAGGLRLARGVLIFQIAAGMMIALVVVTGRSANAARFVAFAGPAVAAVTLVLLAIALHRTAAARIEGLPRLALSVGAALTLWWGAVRLQQVTALFQTLKDSYGRGEALEAAQWFSIVGPLVATLGLALVGSAIASFARHRGDEELRGVATGRTIAFLATTLASIGLQAGLAKATSLGGALMLVVLAAIGSIVGLMVLAGLLTRAAEAIEAAPGLPPARVV